MFSIGFRSGDCGGHSMHLNGCLLNQSITKADLCFGSLSCMNINLDLSMPYSSIVLFKSSFNVSKYISLFMFFPTSTMNPTPSHVMQLQAMIFSPPYFKVCLTCRFCKFSSDLFHA